MAESFVTLATFGTVAEAELARNLLREEGLNAFLADAETVNMLWPVGGALGGIKLQVAAEDERRARTVLRRRAELPGESSTDDYGIDQARTKSMVRARPYDAPSEEDDDVPESRADAIARRAWRLTVFGLLLVPFVLPFPLLFLVPSLLHVASVVLIAILLDGDDPLSSKGQRLYYGAIAVDVLGFAAAAVLGKVFFGRLF